jgi:hypothetical protein
MSLTRSPTRRKPLLHKAQTAVALPASVQARVQRLRQQHLLGAGFAAQLVHRPRAAHAPVRIAVAASLACLGAIGGLLAWLQSSWPLAACGVLALSGGLTLAWRLRRVSAPAALPWWDAAAVQRLDALLQACAPELPTAAVALLDDIKAALARMAPHVASGPPGPPFRPDDLFFLAELLRRYVPDTLQAYLQVPLAQRSVAVAAPGDAADTVLCAQLVSLREQVAERELRLAQAQTEPLLQQGRFLRAKRGP